MDFQTYVFFIWHTRLFSFVILLERVLVSSRLVEFMFLNYHKIFNLFWMFVRHNHFTLP